MELGWENERATFVLKINVIKFGEYLNHKLSECCTKVFCSELKIDHCLSLPCIFVVDEESTKLNFPGSALWLSRRQIS